MGGSSAYLGRYGASVVVAVVAASSSAEGKASYDCADVSSGGVMDSSGGYCVGEEFAS